MPDGSDERGNRAAGPADGDGADPATALHDHLVATETLPVEREAGWYLGEAQAIAADLAAGDLAESVAGERAAEVRELLAEIDGTGDVEADDHVAAARELAARIAERSGSDTGHVSGVGG
ncbi:hypothetical protein [Halorubrum halodurans]|uniref:DUF8152 domain-containing protein n=1 Tax=Halorubrum halodurans TaxID=1383851 RepID=A0A256IFZ4_9EURY|nr:hypothetical protein [Halorubrum halodurans]OYR55449.1 hypothetical protein DJ70_11785 [Halorubrum halodurans]